jgi:3-isopropylmalate/(R)-2-methylmalate dehydratase small subunit
VAGFTTHTGRIAVVPGDQIDTDRIIPARFLSRIERAGYGELLFSDVRGSEFALDQPDAQGATIMVVGCNFGCGSSREHAVWAIQQAGFKAVIARFEPDAPGFSDIFRQNAENCGLLLIELPPTEHAKLVEAGSGAEATIDLPNQTIAVQGATISFEINPATKASVLAGLDLIGSTLQFGDAISAYEARSAA